MGPDIAILIADHFSNLSHRLKRQMNQKLISGLGISLSEMRILAFVKSYENCKAKDIVPEFGFSARAVTEVIDHLENNGWVIRITSPLSRREKIIHLTSEGHDILLKAIDRRGQTLVDMLTPLTNNQLSDFLEILCTLENWHQSMKWTLPSK